MPKIIIGSFDQVLGTVGLGSNNDWILEPSGDSTQSLQYALDHLYARWQQEQPNATKKTFLAQSPKKFVGFATWVGRVPTKRSSPVYPASTTQSIAAAQAKEQEMMAAFEQRTAAKRKRPA